MYEIKMVAGKYRVLVVRTKRLLFSGTLEECESYIKKNKLERVYHEHRNN